MMGTAICKLMCRLVVNNHQRYLLIFGVRSYIGVLQNKLDSCDKRYKTYIREMTEQIDALYELEEMLSKCETYYEEV